jgi:hypothetical protein
VKRHYLGCAGRVANGITTVYLAYVREFVCGDEVYCTCPRLRE